MRAVGPADLVQRDCVYQASKIENISEIAKRANVHERTALRMLGGLSVMPSAVDAIVRAARDVLGRKNKAVLSRDTS